MKVLIEMTFCLIIFYVLYKLILDHSAMHRFKRFYLLGALVLSLTLPFISLEISTNEVNIPTSSGMIEEGAESFSQLIYPQSFFEVNQAIPEIVPGGQTTEHSANKSWILLVFYGFITLILGVRYFYRLFKILQSARGNHLILPGGIKLILRDDSMVPYNFLNLIFMSLEDYKNESSRDTLLKHELEHAKQKHSLDILLIEFLKVMFWFQPLFYWYSKAIRTNHEYLADDRVLKDTNDVKSYQALLLKFINQNNIGLPLTSPSNYGLTKKRFKMMKQRISKTTAALKVALLTPMLLLTTFFIGLESNAKSVFDVPFESLEKLNQTQIYSVGKPDIPPLDTTNNYYVFSKHTRDTDIDSDEFIKSPGIRFQAMAGTEVLATADGIVKRIGNEAHARGHFLFIDHDGEYETRYFSVSEISVKEGQSVKKGEKIAVVGKPKHSKRSQVFYEVLKDNAYDNPIKYMNISPSHIPVIRYLTVVDEKTRRKYGLKANHHKVNFVYGQRFASIIYDDERVLFFKPGKEDPLIKQVNDISNEQMKIIHSFILPPPPSPAKRAPIKAIVDNWHDPKQFGVWIDGKKVENEVLKNYTVKDFAHHSVSKLYPNAKNYGSHDYQLNLTTHEVFEARKKREREAYNKWFEKTESMLSKLDIK